jgi:Xaa-Pro aminopeptidase
LEDQLINKKATLDEVDGADKLESIRSKHNGFMGLSFDTISSTGANAAIIHYKPEKGECATIDPKAIYLCDSGAQYQDGTTDTTRTLHFGEPTEMERKAYTLVLKGNIALELIKFPKGTTGFAIDALARQFLWAEGLVTMTPHCRNLVDMSLITEDEKKFINDYHKEVFEKTSEYFKDDALTLNWLKRETAPY